MSPPSVYPSPGQYTRSRLVSGTPSPPTRTFKSPFSSAAFKARDTGTTRSPSVSFSVSNFRTPSSPLPTSPREPRPARAPPPPPPAPPPPRLRAARPLRIASAFAAAFCLLPSAFCLLSRLPLNPVPAADGLAQLKLPVGLCELVLLLDEQPLALAPLHADERERAAKLLAFEFELQLPAFELSERVRAADELVRAAVPAHVLARAVLAFGYAPFELQVLDRVIFGLDGQAALRRVERRPARHRPGLQDPAHLQAEVEVKLRRVVLLHDEAVPVNFRDTPARLRRPPEVAHLLISLKPHTRPNPL